MLWVLTVNSLVSPRQQSLSALHQETEEEETPLVKGPVALGRANEQSSPWPGIGCH